MHEITTDQSMPPARSVVSTESEQGQEYDVRKTDEVPARSVVSMELEPAFTRAGAISCSSFL